MDADLLAHPARTPCCDSSKVGSWVARGDQYLRFLPTNQPDTLCWTADTETALELSKSALWLWQADTCTATWANRAAVRQFGAATFDGRPWRPYLEQRIHAGGPIGVALASVIDALAVAQAERLTVEIVGVLEHMLPALAHGLPSHTSLGTISASPVSRVGQLGHTMLLQLLDVPASCPATQASEGPAAESGCQTPFEAAFVLVDNLLKGRSMPRQYLLNLKAELARGQPFQPMMLGKQLSSQAPDVQLALLLMLTGSAQPPVPPVSLPALRPAQPVDGHASLSLDLDYLNSWEFSAFAFCDIVGDSPLRQATLALLEGEGLITALALDPVKLGCFCTTLGRGYSRDNPYHNEVHAVGVLQATHMLLKHGGVGTFLRAKHPDVGDALCLSAYLAAAMHDYGECKHCSCANVVSEYMCMLRSGQATSEVVCGLLLCNHLCNLHTC